MKPHTHLLCSLEGIKAGQERYIGLDLASAYHAVLIRKSDWGLTAFQVSDKGYYCYTRMPFGLTGAGATCQEMILEVSDDMIGREMVTRVGDLCVAGKSWNALDRLREMFERCRSKGLSLSPTKADLFMSEITWAGVTLSSKGITLDREKVGSILSWPTPTSAHQLLDFLSSMSYFRNATHRFAEIAEPLYALVGVVKVQKESKRGDYKTALLTSDISALWQPPQEKAFARLKASLTSAPTLKPFTRG